MAKYTVSVIVSATVDVEVEALDAEEAKEFALEAIDPFNIDNWDYEVDYVDKDEDDDEEEEEEE